MEISKKIIPVPPLMAGDFAAGQESASNGCLLESKSRGRTMGKWADKMFAKKVVEFEAGTLSVSGLASYKVEYVSYQETLIAKRIKDFDKAAENTVLGAYNKWLKDNKKFQTFRIRLAIKIASNTLKLAINTAMIAIA